MHRSHKFYIGIDHNIIITSITLMSRFIFVHIFYFNNSLKDVPSSEIVSN